MESRLRFRQWFVDYISRSANAARTDRIIEEKDLVIIGGGVAGYVAAIKAGQEGMKVGGRSLVHGLRAQLWFNF